jgi:hypothetical protein
MRYLSLYLKKLVFLEIKTYNLVVSGYFFLINIVSKSKSITQIVINISAKLNIAKYFTQIKSITSQKKILSIQFQIAQPNISPNQISFNFQFSAFSL